MQQTLVPPVIATLSNAPSERVALEEPVEDAETHNAETDQGQEDEASAVIASPNDVVMDSEAAMVTANGGNIGEGPSTPYDPQLPLKYPSSDDSEDVLTTKRKVSGKGFKARASKSNRRSRAKRQSQGERDSGASEKKKRATRSKKAPPRTERTGNATQDNSEKESRNNVGSGATGLLAPRLPVSIPFSRSRAAAEAERQEARKRSSLSSWGFKAVRPRGGPCLDGTADINPRTRLQEEVEWVSTLSGKTKPFRKQGKGQPEYVLFFPVEDEMMEHNNYVCKVSNAVTSLRKRLTLFREFYSVGDVGPTPLSEDEHRLWGMLPFECTAAAEEAFKDPGFRTVVGDFYAKEVARQNWGFDFFCDVAFARLFAPSLRAKLRWLSM